MPSIFDTLMATATPIFLGVDGTNISYQPVGGAVKTISAIIHTQDDLNILEGNVDLQFRRKVIEISARNNTEGQTAIKVRGDAEDGGGDVVLLPGDSAIWYVTDIQSEDAGMFVLQLTDQKEERALLNGDGDPITNGDGQIIRV